MRLYLFRHPESDAQGELTPRGREQTHEIMDWLVAEIGRVDMVIAWGIPASLSAAQIAADKLGTFVALTVIPEHWEAEQADEKIRQMAERATDVMVIVPDSRYLEYFVGSARMNHGATACLLVTAEAEALQWLVTRGLVFRSTEQAQVAEAARGFVRALTEAGGATPVMMKRWVLGDGGKSGNCEVCIDNAGEGDDGWVEEGFTYQEDVYPVDGPLGHPNCTCHLEYKEFAVLMPGVGGKGKAGKAAGEEPAPGGEEKSAAAMVAAGQMPFGPYRGTSIDSVAKHEEYIDALIKQPWLNRNFPGLLALLLLARRKRKKEQPAETEYAQ